MLRAFHYFHCIPCAILQGGNHILDFLRGLLGTAGEGTHFVGHHCKTAPLFTGACSFDCSIQRQQVGLFSDTTDHVQHRTDILTLLLQVAYNLGRGVHLCQQSIDTPNGFGRHQRTIPGFTVR